MRCLQHHADPRLDGVHGVLSVIASPDSDHATSWLVKAADHVDHRGLACPRRPHQCNCLASLYPQREISQHRLLRVVIEIDALKYQIPSDCARVHRAGSVCDLRHRVD